MSHSGLKLILGFLFVGAVVAGCGSDDTSSGSDVGDSDTSNSTTAADTAGGDDPGDEAVASGSDACEVLSVETIAAITGADPGPGELEDTGFSMICRYWGDTQLVVQIDPGSVMESARTSEEAYGRICEPIDDIGDDALYCWSSPTAQGAIGEIVWTDGDQTYYVEYNYGQQDPSKDIPLQLAEALEP
jgi:hypothetical protein